MVDFNKHLSINKHLSDNDKVQVINSAAVGTIKELFTTPVEYPKQDYQAVQRRSFASDIVSFNQMYGMTKHDLDDVDAIYARLTQFKKMLVDEVDEVDSMLDNLMGGEGAYKNTNEFLTELADWLGDIQIFCASEMERFDIPLYATLSIIMDSNFSKKQADGTALFVDGKLQKGPNYWKPEPVISDMLKSHAEVKSAIRGWNSFSSDEDPAMTS